MSGIAVVKKCFNCRADLTENTGTPQCQKCKKNEEKYGQATTCQFCHLNAAFRDKKCVYCASSVRRFGEPIHCANCQLNCAFPKSERARKAATKTLCRLCIMQAIQTKQSVLAGVSVNLDREKKDSGALHSKKAEKRKKEPLSEEMPTKYGRAGTTTNAFGILAADTLAESQSQMKIQKLNDEISRLNSVIQTKDSQLMEKDKTINNLKAENYNQEKKHRERVQQLQKEKEESIRMVEQIRNKTKKN